MAGRLFPFSLQIAVALFGIVCCGPSTAAQTIMPCYRSTMATVGTARHSMEKPAGENGVALARLCFVRFVIPRGRGPRLVLRRLAGSFRRRKSSNNFWLSAKG
jgi:hypothetical protein